MEKTEFRRQALIKRKQIKNRKQKSTVITERILKLDCFRKAKTIFLYCSYHSEAETAQLLEAILLQGKQAAVPKVLSGRMQFYQIHSLNDIETGYKGIPEPKGDGEILIPEKDDLMLIPGIAFDKEGYRMGYGGGFYDRYLAEHLVSCKKIGVAFSEQIYEQIPREWYDVRMDAVITE